MTKQDKTKEHDYKAAQDWHETVTEKYVLPLSKPTLFREANSIKKLRDQVNELNPNRNKVSDGTWGDMNHANRDSDHNPWVINGNYGVVTAIDITHDLNLGINCELLAQSLVDSKDPRIKYIIWNSRMVSSYAKSDYDEWEWRDYNETVLNSVSK